MLKIVHNHTLSDLRFEFLKFMNLVILNFHELKWFSHGPRCENTGLLHVNNKGSDQSAQSDQRLSYSLT